MRLGWAPAGVRARMLGLLGVAAVPLVLLAAWISWQNGTMVAARATAGAEQVSTAALARYGLLLTDLSDALGALAIRGDLLGGAPEACDAAMRTLPGFASGRYANVGLLDTAGALRCSAVPFGPASPPRGTSMANDDWYRAALASGEVAIGHLSTGPISGRPVLIAGLKLRDGDGMAVVGLSVDWLATRAPVGFEAGSAVWLIDPAGKVIPINAAPAAALPGGEGLARLLAGLGPAQLASATGALFAYAVADLPNGLRLLAAVPATAIRRQADRVVITRFVVLAALVALGFAAVARGAGIAVVDPLKRLAHAVRHWRAGGIFVPGAISDMPQEIRELAASFAQATAALAEHEQRLRAALEQQDLLMQEIHHRVKNNLQIVASLLNLQASRIRQPEARSEFQAARDRIRALATLHRHLYAEGDLHAINMRSFLVELCNQLLQAVGDRRRISLTIEAPELRLSSDQAVPLALIVTEAVSNAAKYAFPGGREGHIQVRLTSEEEGQLRLVIEDDGVGIPGGRAETETGVRDGIGLQLIRGFARQLGATLSITEDHGTRYELVLHLRRTRPEGAASAQAVLAESAQADMTARE